MSNRLVLTLCALLITLIAPRANAQTPYETNLIPAVRTSQDEINSGTLSLHELFYRGAHIYTNRFTTNDHYGEGPMGPRMGVYRLGGNPHTPFVRINGLDGQACFDCHSVIGYRNVGEFRFPREPGIVGGPAAISASVMIFPNPADMLTGIVRNPPHTFGHGYEQRLTDEMTADLLAIRDAALAQAELDQAPVQADLITKGVSFGYIIAQPGGMLDTSNIEGISADLVLRPFQFKAITSTIRSFVRNAMNFHFSIQAKELLDRALIDDDQDDLLEEVSEGEVSTVAIFLAMLRPPVQSTEGLDPAAVGQGQSLFNTINCADCHIPSLRINDPLITIADPRVVFRIRQRQLGDARDFISLKDGQTYKHPLPLMQVPEARSEDLPPVLEYNWRKAPERHATLAGLPRAAITKRPPGYTFSLNSADLPPESYPRLAYNPDGTIDVPVFSDFKRHDMGEHLSDTMDEPTDAVGHVVPKRQFMTRPLWGVADTGPYLHDGRALTLREAILMHEGPGSEANPVIQTFKALPPEEQEAIVTFLRSLRVPSAPRAFGDTTTALWLTR